MDATNLMDITQVAAMFHVRPRTISHWVRHKEDFPEPLKKGKKPLWIASELETYIHTSKQDRPAMPKLKPEPRARGVRAARNSAELHTMLAALRAQQMQKRAGYSRG